MRHWEPPITVLPRLHECYCYKSINFMAYSEDDVTFSWSKIAWSPRGRYTQYLAVHFQLIPWHRSTYAKSITFVPITRITKNHTQLLKVKASHTYLSLLQVNIIWQFVLYTDNLIIITLVTSFFLPKSSTSLQVADYCYETLFKQKDDQ